MQGSNLRDFHPYPVENGVCEGVPFLLIALADLGFSFVAFIARRRGGGHLPFFQKLRILSWKSSSPRPLVLHFQAPLASIGFAVFALVCLALLCSRLFSCCFQEWNGREGNAKL